MTHDEVRDQLILMALGEPADDLSAVLRHTAHCPECRAFAQDVERVLSHLPEALPAASPPPGLRARVLAKVQQSAPAPAEEQVPYGDVPAGLPPVAPTRVPGNDVEPEPEAGETRSGDPAGASGTGPASVRSSSVTPRHRRPGSNQRSWWARLGAAFAQPAVRYGAAAAILLALNVTLLWDTIAQRRELAALNQLYTDEVSWLRTAENLLVTETPPAARAQLLPLADPPGGRDDSISADGAMRMGNAAVYWAYQDTFYLIVKCRGLEPGTAYEVWLRDAGEPRLLGIFISTAAGDGTLVYRGQAPAPVAASLGVRPVGGSGPVLTGLLEPTGTPANLGQPWPGASAGPGW